MRLMSPRSGACLKLKARVRPMLRDEGADTGPVRAGWWVGCGLQSGLSGGEQFSKCRTRTSAAGNPRLKNPATGNSRRGGLCPPCTPLLVPAASSYHLRRCKHAGDATHHKNPCPLPGRTSLRFQCRQTPRCPSPRTS
jgi:hypothetical protein